MPPLKVEYAKSGRSKCSLKACSAVINKHEVRIGTGMVLPFIEDSDELQFKWRHLCCFTEQQLKNSRASGDLDKIDGYNELAPTDQALIEDMKKGLLVGKQSILGRVGDVVNAPVVRAATGKREPAKKRKRGTGDNENGESGDEVKQPVPPIRGKAKAAAAKLFVDCADDGNGMKGSGVPTAVGSASGPADDLWECETVECDVEIVEQPYESPACPFGRNCNRTNPQHFRDYSHGELAAPESSVGAVVKVPVVKRWGTSASVDGMSAAAAGGITSHLPLCPSGSLCSRKDAVHSKAFRH